MKEIYLDIESKQRKEAVDFVKRRYGDTEGFLFIIDFEKKSEVTVIDECTDEVVYYNYMSANKRG